ncbi:IS1 family transposase [Brevibacillus sp. SYP-B805]|uniref:IS1 family transposase n=1 Tax=Brevibacillus sp. SYP-B805 TaxID=1578199 RepID=UPI0013ED0AF7|nr:IS1 family transposase [Brevibacillus sp. SYP-B805]NGQ95111.1 IS1 family transposase [Brevibacillus sp. SYP-B805]
MTYRSKEENRIAENQHVLADIQRNWKKYQSYAQYNGLQCPKCKSKDAFAFHAHYRGRKRYKCKNCGTTINDLSQSLMHRSRHPKKWLDFMEMAVKGASLGQMSKKLGLSKVTLYRWRKKFLQLATDFYQQRLQGVIAVEEVALTSQAGAKLIRGSRKEGKENEQIFLLVAKDRRDNYLFRMKRNRSKLWRSFLNQVQKNSNIHANVPKSGLPSNLVLKHVLFFGPSEGLTTVEKRDWNSPASAFLRHFAQTSLIYRGITIKYLEGFLSLLALKHKLHKLSMVQRKSFFMYTLLTNNMRAANEQLFN